MSLHNIAQHMQGAGRGQDSMLVHMTPGEVQGLQKLALAHGGSLTINPKTGLPEAGFLSSLLPMIAGFALGPAGMGLTAMQAGLATAAVGTLATGSLSKGIMAGLGAYGGAGLGAGLGAMGAAAGAAPAASTLGSMAPGAASSTLPSMIPNITASPLAAATATPGMTTAGGFAGLSPASLANSGVINRLSGVPIGTPSLTSNLAPPPQTVLRTVAQPQVVAPPTLVRAGESAAFQPRMAPPVQIGNASATQLGYTPSDQLSAQQNPTLAGLKASTSNGLQGFKDLYSAMEKESPYSGMAAGYSLMNAMNQPPPSPTRKKSLIRPYKLDRQRVVDSDVGPSSSAERQYFNDVYTALTPYEAPGPEYAASGGMMGMAEGGYVDEALSHDAVSMDSGRPLPPQQPIYMGMQPQQPQQNIIAQPGNTMTTPGFAGGGVASFADGGELPQYEYLGNNQYKLKNPVATSAAPKLSPTGQPVDASGGYYGPYGQYFNAAGQPQMWYMDPANANDPEAIKSAKAAGITLKSPATTTTTASAPVTTQEGLDALYQKNFGRAADPGGIEAYLNKGYTPEQITGFMQSSEEYAPIKTRLDEEAKQATYANPTQIANVYDKVFGRTPDMGGLDYYSGQNLTPAEVEEQLRQSEEYKKKLTTPFVAPISYTGSKLSYDDINKQLGRNATLAEVKTAAEAFIPNRATIQGAPEYQTPEQKLGLAPTNNRQDQTPDFYAMMNKKLAEQGGYAGGGDINAYSLGGYSDGGRLLRGPGDGVSDDIPASIGDRQPARLADGEFVVPARIVSELGNGSTEAGAKRLYAMMDRVQRARTKTMGKGKVAVNSKADKYLPA